MEGWNSSEGYEAMQRYQSTEAHAFQPFQTSLQEHVGSIGVSNFFQPPPRTPIPPPPPLMGMFAAHSKRKATKEIEEEEDVQIVGPPAPKKKGVGAPKKPRKKNMKEEDEESNSKNWKDHDVETMISLRAEMELEFLKNSKKQGMISTYVNF